MKKVYLATSIIAASMLASTSVLATNGYFGHGYSTKEKGLAGAGVAFSQDSLASATNPAGLVKVGSRMDIGLAIFSPSTRDYTVTGNPSGFPGTFPLNPGTEESDNDIFAIPHFGYSRMLNDRSAIGLSAYGNGGMNTEYNDVTNFGGQRPPGTYYGGTAGVDLKQLFINLTYSYQLNGSNSVGISAIGAVQTFEATGLGAFGQGGFSTDATKLTNNGADVSTGAGVKLGWQGDVTDSFTIGASYQSKIWMSEFDDYAGLFADGGDFDIPATATVGIAWNATDNSTLVLDVQQIYYGDVKSLNNGIENLQAFQDGSGRLGGTNGAGFGWDDMTIYKVGYQFGSDIQYRVGASYGEQPIRDGQNIFNILAPAVVTTHITAGITVPLSASSEFSVSGLYVPNNEITSGNAFDPGQTISLSMEQYEIQGTYSLKF